MTTPSKQQSNSSKRDANATPPRRSRARDDNGEIDAQSNAAAINLHLFSTRLANAAAMRHRALPPGFPFGLSLWLAAVFVVGASGIQ